jgi:hypothetical protein
MEKSNDFFMFQKGWLGLGSMGVAYMDEHSVGATRIKAHLRFGKVGHHCSNGRHTLTISIQVRRMEWEACSVRIWTFIANKGH